MLKHWLRDLRPELEHRGLLKETIAELAAHPPRWETVHHELLPRDVPTDGGTARPSPHQYSLSPDWLARRILALGPYLYDGGQLIFRAMPRGPRDQGAQLVSEPIRFPGPDEKQDSWWSVTLSITLQTVPFDPLPRFNLRWSVRRWATRTNAKTGRLRLPWGASTTVLLRPRRPFLPGTPAASGSPSPLWSATGTRTWATRATSPSGGARAAPQRCSPGCPWASPSRTPTRS